MSWAEYGEYATDVFTRESVRLIQVLYCTVLYCTILYCTVLYCTVLYYTVLYCTVLYCTVLYCMLCLSSLCFCFLEKFLEKGKAEGVEELLVDWHMVQVLNQVFRYCTLCESR